MAAWQVALHIVPRQALATTAHPLTATLVDNTNWWSGERFPSDYRARLAAVAAPAQAVDAALESWGEAQGNCVEVTSDGGVVTRMMVRVDARRLDAKFGAAILGFVRAANAVMIRADGLVLQPTIAAFAGALRSSAAWRYANDAAASPTSGESLDD